MGGDVSEREVGTMGEGASLPARLWLVSRQTILLGGVERLMRCVVQMGSLDAWFCGLHLRS